MRISEMPKVVEAGGRNSISGLVTDAKERREGDRRLRKVVHNFRKNSKTPSLEAEDAQMGVVMPLLVG